MTKPLDVLGEFLMKNGRDKGFQYLSLIEKGATKKLAPLSRSWKRMTPAEKRVVRRCVAKALNGSIHDLLFALCVEGDFDDRIRLMVLGENAAKLSDGLQGEMYGDAGWIARFSAFDEEGAPRRVRRRVR